MNKPYSFSNDQMNGIVEDTYANIINECELGNNIIYGTLDKSYLEEIRKNLPALEHQRLDIRKEWNDKK